MDAARGSLYMKTVGVFSKKGIKRSGRDIALVLQLLQVCAAACDEGDVVDEYTDEFLGLPPPLFFI
jgi:hypothetical protein